MNQALKCINVANKLLLAEWTPDAVFLCFERCLIVYTGQHARRYACVTSHACLSPTHIIMAHGGRVLGFSIQSSKFAFQLVGFREIGHIAYCDGRLVIGDADAVFEFQHEKDLLSLVKLASETHSNVKTAPRGFVAVSGFLVYREKKQLCLSLNGTETMRFASDTAFAKGCVLINQVESAQHVLMFNPVASRSASALFTRGVSNLEELARFGKIGVIGYLCARYDSFCTAEHFCTLLRDKAGVIVSKRGTLGVVSAEGYSALHKIALEKLPQQISMRCLAHFEPDRCIFSVGCELYVVWQYGHFTAALDESKVTLEDAVASAVYELFFVGKQLFHAYIPFFESKAAESADCGLFLELIDCVDYAARLAAKIAPFGAERAADVRALIGTSEAFLASRQLLAAALWLRGKEIKDLERMSELVRYEVECCYKRHSYEALRVLYRKIEAVLPDLAPDVFAFCSRHSTLTAFELSFGASTGAAWPENGVLALYVVEAFIAEDIDL